MPLHSLMHCAACTICVQIAMFKEDFQAERNIRAEAVVKLDDMRKKYETKIEETRKDLSTTQAKLKNAEELLLIKQQQLHVQLENVMKQHKDYKEKMESDLAAKAAQVKHYYFICMQCQIEEVWTWTIIQSIELYGNTK